MPNATEASRSQKEKRLSPIEKLPTAVHHFSLFPFLSDACLYNMTVTSKEMLSDYCNSPSRIKQKKASHQLLTHVVRGEEEQALTMLEDNPGLLLFASNATAYSKHIYSNYTPFQAALLCHDVTLWQKMEPYFDKLPNGREEKARQFNAIFPEGISHPSPYDFNALVETITHSSADDIDAALQKTQNDTEIFRVLNRFRSDFKALAMQETFFNPWHLIGALKVYREQFDNWSLAQRDLFWRQVIGYTERFVPACFAQAFVQGLYFIVEEHAPLVRSFKFKYDNCSYFPLVDSSGLGFDFGVYGRCGWPPRRHAWREAGDGVARLLINHIEQIQQNYLNLSEACSMASPLRTMTP